jgi:subtilisin-like proprotein convertase family protein
MKTQIDLREPCHAFNRFLTELKKFAAPSAWLAAMLWIIPTLTGLAAESGSEWTFVPVVPVSQAGLSRWVEPSRGGLFRLDRAMIQTNYAKIFAGEPAAAVNFGKEISLPMPDGSLTRFKIVEASIMEPALAAKFPEIKTYAGQGIDDPQATVRLDLSPAGFHAQVLSPNGAVYVEPAYRNDVTLHVSYYKRDLLKSGENWNCLTDGDAGIKKSASPDQAGSLANKIQSGATLRTYRLAVACTGEYAAFFGGTVPNAMAAIVSAVNRVDGVYETELAIRLVLVANNDLIVYTNATTDPYANNNGSTMLTQNQTTLTSVIGSANYDIGHVFSTGGGGVALLGCVCNSSTKAEGVTGSTAPTGDAFWIDYVAHEMGHQFGANHTFNSSSGSCGGGNRNASTAYERGSGITIMAYAGICSPDDLALNSDPYFHGISIDEIQAYVTSGGGSSCSVNTATGNGAPSVSAGANYSIPASTPFALTATGSDPNGDPLTYAWEEFDLGAATTLTTGDNGSSPIFRPQLPTSSPVRYFPKMSSILANTNWNQEVLPTTSRTMTFRVTARDNRVGGGGVADATMAVTTVAGAGPFVVTAPNTAVNWSGIRTVTWNVAGTTNAPISAGGVNIYLSTNSGVAFPFLLASNVPNIGAATVVLPNLNSTQARIQVQGNGNIFFDISDVNFTISPGSAAPLIQLAGTTLISGSCIPTNTVIDPYENVAVSWTLANFGSTATTNLVATLLATNGVYYPGSPQTYGVIGAGSNVTRTFTFVPSGACGGSVTGLVSLVDGASNLGTVSAVFTLGTIQTTVVTQIFNNAASITINDATSATPYPSVIAVAGVSGATKVTATINGLAHAFPRDLSMLLVGPGGQKVKLMGRTGGGTAITGRVLTFDDNAGVSLPTTAIASGTYLPTDFAATNVFLAPAPAGPYGSTLAPLLASPNGNWSLYLQDFEAADAGSVSGGWSLKFTASFTTTNCCSTVRQPTLTSTTYSNGVVSFNWDSLPGPQYQVQFRTNLIEGAWQNLGASLLGTSTTMGITDSITNSDVRFYRVQASP